MASSFTQVDHSWDVSISKALQLQKQLQSEVKITPTFNEAEVKTIAGMDMALCKDAKNALGSYILYEYPTLKELHRHFVKAPFHFPYVPGLLSFREIPVLIEVLKQAPTLPDVLILDGQGIAHPRRLGIASHLGLILNISTIGFAKSLLCGHYQEPENTKGSFTALMYKQEQVGFALRSKEKCKPVFISPGHLISLEASLHIAQNCLGKYRIPIPTHQADAYLKKVKLENVGDSF